MIYVCVLTRESINVHTVCDIVALMNNSGDCLFSAAIGTYVNSLREGVADAVVQSGATHLLFLDSDMMFPKDSLKRLLERDKDIIGANYIQRVCQDTWTAQINGEQVVSLGNRGIQEVDVIGMGVCLIKTDVFKKLKKPYFDMPFDGMSFVGEDVSFCRLAIKNGFKIYVDHDLSQQVHHVGTVLLGADSFRIPEYQVPNIDGWMTEQEMQWLYSTSYEMNSIIELGSWKGRSTHALASGCKGKVYAIDHWQGSEGDLTQKLAKEGDIYSDFLENTKEFKNVHNFWSNIDDAIDEVPDCDMVFIDATHTYEDAKKDLINWLPKAKKIICGHDYCKEFPGVVKAVTEVIGEPDIVVGTIWSKRII